MFLFIKTSHGIMDLFSGKIVAWELSRTLETAAVVSANIVFLVNCSFLT